MAFFSFFWRLLGGRPTETPDLRASNPSHSRRRAQSVTQEWEQRATPAPAPADAPRSESEISAAPAPHRAPTPATPTRSADADQPAGPALTPGTQPWWIPEGEPITVVAPRGRGEPIDEPLYQGMATVLDDANLDLPRLPKVIDRVLMMLRDPEVDFRKLAELVGQDPALTVEILRRANSVAYRGFTEIRALDVAFARLGHRNLRGVVLGATVKSLSIRVGGAERTLGEELWRRAVASGVVLSQLATHLKVPENQADPFLVGLLHDIGMLAVLKVVHEYQQKTSRRVPRPLFDMIAERWHEHIGLRLADAWALPDPLPQLIGNHHREPADDDPLKTWRLMIQTSEVITSLLGYRTYLPYDFFQLACVKRLGLDYEPEVFAVLQPIPQLIRERLESL